MEPQPLAISCRDDEAEDLISGLPDELLHAILVRLPSAEAAARTSVLSRRWRGVWAHMPNLVLGSPVPSMPSSALLDAIDGALDSYAAPTLHSLKIAVRGVDRCDVHADCIAPWLRFASQRLAGQLGISLFSMISVSKSFRETVIEDKLALPICERATEIDLDFRLNLFRKTFVLRPPQTGSFSALTDLKIACRQMDGGELGRMVSSPICPRLRKLAVDVSDLVPVADVSIRSESLECLYYDAPDVASLECLDYDASDISKLEVTAPVLRELVLLPPAEACFVAPKLEKIHWHGAYDPGRHQLAVSSRHIQSLCIKHWSSRLDIPMSSTRLMEGFDTETEMVVSLQLMDQDIEGYVTLLKEMDKLPECETLVINLLSLDKHCLLPIMLCILRRCSCMKKLKLSLRWNTPSKISSCTMLDCPCLQPEIYRSDDITLDSLEEIGISFFTGSAEQQDFIEVLLSRCNMVTLKRLDIMVPSTHLSSEITEFVERIRTMYSKVQLNVLTREVLKPLAS